MLENPKKRKRCYLHKWQSDEENFIRIAGPAKGIEFCANALRVTYDQVRWRGRKLGVTFLPAKRKVGRNGNYQFTNSDDDVIRAAINEGRSRKYAANLLGCDERQVRDRARRVLNLTFKRKGKELYPKQFTLRIDDAIYSHIQKFAHDEGKSVCGVIREILQRYVKEGQCADPAPK